MAPSTLAPLLVAVAAACLFSACLAQEDLPPIPIVNRTTEQIVLAQERTSGPWSIDFFRNNNYSCGLTGQYTFMVINPRGGGQVEAPLWIYMHGGASGYWDEAGTYYAGGTQTEDTWNHEETFDDLANTLKLRGVDLKNPADPLTEDNTLTRRLKGGYRMLVVAMCDHDQYLGMGTPYPNNPNPGAEVNGLQATMAAIDHTAANYPTTHVFVHGTSAGSVGAYAVGMSYAAEDIALTGVVADSILGPRGKFIIDHFAGQPGFTQQAGYNSSAFDAKVGVWREDASQLDPEWRIGAGFNKTPILQIGGLVDGQCAGNRDPLPEAEADGFANNCAWMAQPLRDLIKDLEAGPGTLHVVAQIAGEGHVPTTKPGAAHGVVDAFINRTIAKEQAHPFASPPTPTANLTTSAPTGPTAAPTGAPPPPGPCTTDDDSKLVMLAKRHNVTVTGCADPKVVAQASTCADTRVSAICCATCAPKPAPAGAPPQASSGNPFASAGGGAETSTTSPACGLPISNKPK